MSLLVMPKILILFFNTLAANDKFSIVIVRIFDNQFKCNYVMNKKILPFWLILGNLHYIFNTLKQR